MENAEDGGEKERERERKMRIVSDEEGEKKGKEDPQRRRRAFRSKPGPSKVAGAGSRRSSQRGQPRF